MVFNITRTPKMRNLNVYFKCVPHFHNLCNCYTVTGVGLSNFLTAVKTLVWFPCWSYAIIIFKNNWPFSFRHDNHLTKSANQIPRFVAVRPHLAPANLA